MPRFSLPANQRSQSLLQPFLPARNWSEHFRSPICRKRKPPPRP